MAPTTPLAPSGQHLTLRAGDIMLNIRSLFVLLAGLCFAACATVPPPPPPPPPEAQPDPNMVSLLEYETKTLQLLQATEQLMDLQENSVELRRRLNSVCLDHDDHNACSPHRTAKEAREMFCADTDFTGHVDEVVAACHQGQCKQVDQAQLLGRTQYMTLIQRLPHTLVTFRARETELDSKDKMKLQSFLESLGAEAGYIIIVGRASKEGLWRKNLEYALGRAESARAFVVNELGMDKERVGFITYGHEKMYLTDLDAERLSSKRKLSKKQANRSAFVFAYPCH
jgi:outer membrane protein OmpA-like peptidoglycan-associated protein